MIYLKRGAMFGLDARIALAIFGALSVISGVALYTAIQDSKSTSILVMFKELFKASEQYVLDTGLMVPLVASENLNMQTFTLDNGVRGWNGPYIDIEDISSTALKYKSYSIYAKIRQGTSWTTAYNAFPDSCSGGISRDCYEWFFLYANTSNTASEISYLKTLFLFLDKKVDNADGVDSGDIRFREGLSSTSRLYFRGRARI